MFYVEKKLRMYHELNECDQEWVVDQYRHHHDDPVLFNMYMTEKVDEFEQELENKYGLYDVKVKYTEDEDNLKICAWITCEGFNFRTFLESHPLKQISETFMTFFNENDISLKIESTNKVCMTVSHDASSEYNCNIPKHIINFVKHYNTHMSEEMTKVYQWLESDQRMIETVSDLYLFDDDLNFYLMDNTNYYEKKFDLSYEELEEFYLKHKEK